MTIPHDGFLLWFTGLSGAGKSTLARLVAGVLRERHMRVEVLDGDEVRRSLCHDLGFSKADRDENIRRIGYVARLLARNGVVAITAAISPYRALRREMRAAAGPGRFVQVWCKARLEALIERDVKGLYARAMAGEIANFTGVSDPYEEPENAEIVVETDREDEAESLHRIVRSLELMQKIPGPQDGMLLEEGETERIRARLAALGYLEGGGGGVKPG